MTHPDINELLELLQAVKKEDVSSQMGILEHIKQCNECYDQFCRLARISDTMENPDYMYISKKNINKKHNKDSDKDDRFLPVEEEGKREPPQRYVIPLGLNDHEESESEEKANGSNISESSFKDDDNIHIISDEHEQYMSSGKTFSDRKTENKRDLSKDDIEECVFYKGESHKEKPILTHPRNGWIYIAILAFVLLSVGLVIVRSVMFDINDTSLPFAIESTDDNEYFDIEVCPSFEIESVDNSESLDIIAVSPFATEPVEDKEPVSLQLANIGDRVLFGRYEQDNKSINGSEDIEWIVLDKEEDGTLLLLSRYALDAKLFNDEMTGATWETCTLRKWLNSDDENTSFYRMAFDEKEKTMVLETELKEYEGEDTIDKVFLLSLEEALEYFKWDKGLVCEATTYSIEHGVYTNVDNKNCYWWLRSSHIMDEGVFDDRAYELYGYNSNFDFIGVRPACRVNPES